MPFELFLALRYLRPKRTFVSVITIISILGVMLGVAVLLIVIAVMSGFDREWRERILSFNAHLRVDPVSGLMRDYPRAMNAVAANPLVKGVSPYVRGQLMLQTQPPTTNEEPLISAPLFRGIDPAREGQVSVLPHSMIRGEFDVEQKGLLIGSQFAHELRLNVGDHVGIYSPQTIGKIRGASNKADAEAIPPDDFEVRGIFDVGFNDFNRGLIVLSLKDAQDLYNLGEMVHGLYVMLHDPFQVEAAARELQDTLGPGYRMILWTKENAEIFAALATEKTMMYVILFVVMIVAAFAIVNSEITFAVNKMKEIGLLKSLGAANRQVMWIFLSHSIAVGVLGVGLGFALGLVFLHNLNNILHGVRNWIGFELLPPAIYQINEVPYELLPHDAAIIGGGGFLICVLAGLLPAWKASRLQPVEALRNE